MLPNLKEVFDTKHKLSPPSLGSESFLISIQLMLNLLNQIVEDDLANKDN